MQARALHLHSYFLFPFAVDKEAVMEDHVKVWEGLGHWIDGVDTWIAQHGTAIASPVTDRLGRWRRDPYVRFDLESPAYQDMVFFHPFVRRVFFDTKDSAGEVGENESLVRNYSIPLVGHHEAGRKLMLEAEDSRGRTATVEVTDLRLMVFANGIGILSLGVESFGLPMSSALWINEMMRKVYPSSGRQLREGRTPSRFTLFLDGPQGRQVMAEERFERCVMKGFLPPLTSIITSLIYFANYDQQEYEPVLDERMIVYSYLAVDPRSVPAGFDQTEAYEILFSRLLYVDRWGEDYRYDNEFTREAMRRDVYRRWAHQGTLYGFTFYSNVTMTIGTFDCDEHDLREGFLVHRMFTTRYYLALVVALFYRATLLDFSERSALVSRQLFRRHNLARISPNETLMAQQLLAEFQHFSNYWYFSELANKDEEIEHFKMQCEAFRLEPIEREVEEEIEKLSGTLERLYMIRSTDAVNRLAVVSILLGAGAMVTGFFGMNFGRQFDRLLFNPEQNALFHNVAIGFVSLIALGSLAVAGTLIVFNWSDYRTILLPPSRRHGQPESIRRTPDWAPPGGE